MVEIGSFTPVPIREIWPKEDADFTPWLASHISRLGEALGIELREPAQTEVSVGPFKLDILAEDEEGRKVAIENQYGVTNHDHLGQSLTYAAGKDASVVVWLVETFRPEHRLVFEWLNRHTHEGIEFYAVQLSAVKIDISPPVPIFEVVARPNKPSAPKPSAADGDLYSKFCQQVIDELVKRQFVNQKKSSENAHIIFWSVKVTGGNGVALGADFTSSGARAYIYLDPFGDRNRNHQLLDQLEENKDDIQQGFGKDGLQWSKLSVRACRIWSSRSNVGIKDPEQKLTATAHWMVESLVALRENVLPEVQNAIAALKDSTNQY